MNALYHSNTYKFADTNAVDDKKKYVISYIDYLLKLLRVCRRGSQL